MSTSPVRFCHECGAGNATHVNTCFVCKSPLEDSGPLSDITASNSSSVATVAPSVSGGQRQVQVQVAASASPSEPLRKGDVLARRYRIVREIGQGGFGVVYLARDRKSLYRTVAIKQINIGKLSPREIIEVTDSYNREVSLLTKFRHAHVPRIYNYFTDPEHWYIVMDYIDGKTIEEYVEEKPGKVLSLKEVTDIGVQLCAALNYLHSQDPPIIFRDLKPANIMRTRKGRIYLIDFGIARRYAPGRTKDTGPLGTPGYAAPEQYGLAQTTAHTDIYGLGATLQTLLTGKDPLELRAEGVDSLNNYRIPDEVRQLLEQMLAKQTFQRPKNTQEIKLRLENFKMIGWGKWLLGFWGFFWGVIPYLTIQIMSTVNTYLNQVDYAFPLLAPLIFLMLCLSPICLLGQFIASVVAAFSPGKRRFFGAGMLMGVILVILVVIGSVFLPR